MLYNRIHIGFEPEAVAEEIANLIASKIKQKKNVSEPFNLAISGGNTPNILFDMLAEELADKIAWNTLRLFWVDERCVDPNDPESNFGNVYRILLKNVPIPPENIFNMKGDNEPVVEVLRYQNVLKKELPEKNGLPVFDLVLLGMGDDGHTASIFPHEIELWNNENNCVTATHPESGQIRVSLTGKVINAAKNVVFLVTGKNKAEKVKEIIEQPDVMRKKYPAALVQPDSDNLYWYLDEYAAEMIMGFTV